MVADYSFSMANFKVPDQPTNPPEPDDATWEKINRNSMRQEAIEALGTVISRLSELDYDVLAITEIEGIRLALIMEMEDDHG